MILLNNSLTEKSLYSSLITLANRKGKHYSNLEIDVDGASDALVSVHDRLTEHGMFRRQSSGRLLLMSSAYASVEMVLRAVHLETHVADSLLH